MDICQIKGPKTGDRVVSCGHSDIGPVHWHMFYENVVFRRPDGTIGEASWASICDECHSRSQGKINGIDITDDYVLLEDIQMNEIKIGKN